LQTANLYLLHKIAHEKWYVEGSTYLNVQCWLIQYVYMKDCTV